MEPGRASSLKGTFLAMDILRMLDNTWASVDVARLQAVMGYVLDKQMDDGGFKIGDDLDNILGMFTGESLELYKGIINENLSAIEPSYWAIRALRDVRALNLNVDFEDSTAYDQSALVSWVQTVQNPDGGFSSVLAFKSEIVGTRSSCSTCSGRAPIPSCLPSSSFGKLKRMLADSSLPRSSQNTWAALRSLRSRTTAPPACTKRPPRPITGSR
jgi:prenyltransferase beta subunit